MRKITQNAIHALMNRTPFSSSNTSVYESIGFGSTWVMSLHNHPIARLDSDGKIYITSAGWETNTTKERLNGIANVYQKDFQWYLNGKKWADSSQWTLAN